jgi:general stress protein CsbA
VNHVPVHVKHVLLMITVSVMVVVKVLSYLTNSVNQPVQILTIQITLPEPVLLVLLNVLLVTLTDLTETVLIVNLQTISLTDGVVQIVQIDTSHSKT